MERKYDPNDFEYPLNEDIQAIYDAKAEFDKNPNDDWKHYLLQKTIYRAGLTMKSFCSCCIMSAETRSEMMDYFWGLT